MELERLRTDPEGIVRKTLAEEGWTQLSPYTLEPSSIPLLLTLRAGYTTESHAPLQKHVLLLESKYEPFC